MPRLGASDLDVFPLALGTNSFGWTASPATSRGILNAIASEHDVQPGTVALAWLRAQPTIVAPIAGAGALEQVAPLLASATLELSDEALAQLTRASDAYAGATATTA